MKKNIYSCTVIGIILGCSPIGPASYSGVKSPKPPSEARDRRPEKKVKSHEEVIVKLTEMEYRNKSGKITGFNQEGLWYKRDAKQPYTGIVAGYYKATEDRGPIMESKREYIDGVQSGTETIWYANGRKHIELIYENGKAVFMKQWDADGNLSEQE